MHASVGAGHVDADVDVDVHVDIDVDVLDSHVHGGFWRTRLMFRQSLS